MDYVGTAEIAEMFGVSRSRIHRLSQRGDFPLPAFTIGTRRFWRRNEVELWQDQWDRTNVGGRPKTKP